MKSYTKYIFILLYVSLFSKLCRAQFYSYDSYNKKEVKGGVSKGIVSAMNISSIKGLTNKEVKTQLEQTFNNLDNALTEYRKKKRDAAKQIRNQIVSSHASFLPTNNKDSIQHVIDSLNTLLQNLMADRTIEDGFVNQKLQFKYTQKRIPGITLLPIGNAKTAAAFFENSDTIIMASEDGIFKFEHAYLNYLSNSKKLAAYTEPLADYWGPVRLSMGLLALVPSSKDSNISTKKSDSIFNQKTFKDRFRSGGGAIMLNFMYPLLHAHDNKYIDFKIYASPRFCIDVPKEDTSVQRFAHHTQLGVEAQLKINTLNNNFNFLLCFRGLQGWGNSSFYDNMGFTNNERKSFNFNTWTIGFIAKKQVAFYYTWYGGDSKVINPTMPINNSLTLNYQFKD
jgi:hypothetical protein